MSTSATRAERRRQDRAHARTRPACGRECPHQTAALLLALAGFGNDYLFDTALQMARTGSVPVRDAFFEVLADALPLVRAAHEREGDG